LGGSFSIPPRLTGLNPQTQAAISHLLSTAPPLEASQKAVVILPQEKAGPAVGESGSLHKIVQEHLLAGDYAGAESKLQGFLNIRRSPYTEARARFYLAQAYYFQGLYEEALLEFVLTQGQLYTPVQPWLESCFRQLWKRQ
jgi:TolA-binding protein